MGLFEGFFVRPTYSLHAVRSIVTVLAAFACLALAPAVSRAAVAQWIGGSSGTWSTAAGWSGGVVPNNTQSATYLVTVAQQAGIYASVIINPQTPVVEIDQLTLRPTANVNVVSGATLRLRDLGAGTSLQRSLVGGGTLQLATGGTLQVALNGGVISGDTNIQMNGGQINGNGRIENARTISGTGTIGNTNSTTRVPLQIYNVGANGANPANVKISANRNGQTLLLNPDTGAGTTGILNSFATLNATNGGTLVLRGTSTVDNTNGVISADAASVVELTFRANVIGGSISGAGTLRVPSTDSASIRSANLSIDKTLLQGSTTIENTTSTSAIDLSASLTTKSFTNAAGGTIRLLQSTSGTQINFTTDQLTNNGAISGGGTLAGLKLVNAGSITATIPGTPLLLDVTGAGIDLGTTGQLIGNGGVLTVGKLGLTSPVTGSGAANIVASQGGVVDLFSPINLPEAAVVNNGGMTVNAQTTLGSITGSGITTVRGVLNLKQLRSRMLIQSATTFLPDGGVSRSTQLVVGGNGSLNLTNNPVILDYVAGGSNPFMGTLSAIMFRVIGTSTDGRTVGIAQASAIGSPTTWNGESIDDTTVLVLPTFKGDANLDLAVNFDDLVRLAQHYNTAGVWSDGDFDYDGTVDFDDLVGLAQNYAGGPGLAGASGFDSGFAADWALAQSLVPEPVGVLALILTPLVASRRR